MTKHWLDEPGRLPNLAGHFNRPRMSAETIRKLIELKNSLIGVKRSLYEEALIAEEKNPDLKVPSQTAEVR